MHPRWKHTSSSISPLERTSCYLGLHLHNTHHRTMRVLTLLLATAPLLILSAPAPRPEPALAAEVDIVARQGECSNGCTGSW